MAVNFGETERQLLQLFSTGTRFRFNGMTYEVVLVAKPTPSHGECKTDLFIRAKQLPSSIDILTLKISVKQVDHDFLENKISIERARQIFGGHASKIIQDALQKTELRSLFEQVPKIYFRSKGKTEAKAITLGWKFEFVKRKAGKLSGKLDLSEAQIIDVYAGSNLDDDKKNSRVNGVIVKDSGIATHIHIAIPNQSKSAQATIDALIPIEEYVKDKEIFFACKALNYRTDSGRWDGDRPLAVFMDWSIDEFGKLSGQPILSQPLEVRGNECGEKLRDILAQLEVTACNFETLRTKIDEEVTIHY